MKRKTFVVWLTVLSVMVGLLPINALPALSQPIERGSADQPERVVQNDLPTAPVMPQATAISVDGQIDTPYGAPVASDPAGDGNGNANMDLLNLYITDDANYYYFAYTINANIVATNWGKYMLYIDTTNDANGATSDAWGRSVIVTGTHKPEFSIASWNDVATYGTGNIQFFAWNGTAWAGIGTITDAARATTGVTSTLEWKVAKSALGNPAAIWAEVWNTGGGGSDNAQDTINSPANDWNATDWSTQAVLLNSTPYAPVVDGIVDPVYSAPVASDSAGDAPQGNTNMDLLNLYVTDDANYYYFAYTVNADIVATNWGKYMLYIDTTNDANGASTDAWGRNVIVTSTHKPEFSIASWNDVVTYGTSNIQFFKWTGAGWTQDGTITAAARATTGVTSTLEWKVAKSALGNANSLWAEVWNTGSNGGDNAQDTINDPADDWNATNWSSQAILSNSTPVTARHPVVAEVPAASHDNTVWWTELGHDSRDPLYRNPGGAVVTGTPVTLRLRAASNDLTAAKVRVYNDRTNEQAQLNMTLAANDGQYEWWEVTVPASAVPTVYWYRFIAIDGTDTDYYDDDATRDGGWGQAFDESPDYSWQLTVYDPSFQTPDWIKNAVVYQIFPDRFRDGNMDNDTPAGTFFYDEPGGTVTRSLQSDWNQYVCDPRSAGTCSGTYSKNFYGGDLQGLRDKLDYLQDLGVTAVYLNPVFEAPSNHKYDATDFSIIDDNFGDLSTFITLTSELDTRGMHLILDGVFNHTSSDSIYFDRYGRYSPVGACESQNSPYRSWYYFTDVTAGTGTCVGSTGTPNGAKYESWFGYASLPKLRATDSAVRALIYTSGTQSIAPYWMQYADGWRLDVAGDVDPGVTNDPTNDYWEGFRAATHAVNPDTYIVGEEWGNASSWTLGNEWDATMNYQYSSALLSFWRDETFVDNDHNTGSSAGELNPLKPSQVDARLHNWEERYAPPAYQAMMNLLGSHDTSRALFMLDHNTDLISPTLYLNPNYDWSDAIQRLKGVALMQFTLPGAPTIYYGDEVGLVGPTAYAGGKWEDDPYNRQPFPWLDEGGTPFYTHLQSQSGQDVLRNYYKVLTGARNNHAALRTGSFDTLKVDDTNKVYVYGRKWISGTTDSDAAVVLVNRTTTTQTVAVNVGGYLGNGTVFTDVLNSGAVYTVTGNVITVPDVPPMFGALLVYDSGDVIPTAAPTNLSATEGNAQVELSWDAVAGAASYNVYRSLLSGGGYTRIVTGTTNTVYTDTAVSNGTPYYYVVTAIDANGNESVYSYEADALPHAPIGWAGNLLPASIAHTVGLTPTEVITAQVYIAGATNSAGQGADVSAQLGYGISGTNPLSWTLWTSMSYAGDIGDNDFYSATLTPEVAGVFQYVARFSSTNGRDWTYAYVSGTTPGELTVNASADTTPPTAPLNLRVTHWGTDHITLAWDPVADSDLYAYDLYRYSDQQMPGDMAKVGRVLAPTAVYTDDAVIGGHTYTYTVKALDTSFNASSASNEAVGQAIPRQVELRFFATVPDFTPTSDTVYIAGDNVSVFGASFIPDRQPMMQLSATQWMYTATANESTPLQYKYTRGSWDTVENWGTIVGLANRSLTVIYGTTGIMTVTDTVHNWRDPIVMSHFPANGVLQLNATEPITVAFNRMLNTTFITEATFIVANALGEVYSGTFGFSQHYPATYITGTVVAFTPTLPLAHSAYEVTLVASGYVDEGPMQQNYRWNFATSQIDFVTPPSGQVFTAVNGTSVDVPLVITTTNFAIPTDGHWHLWVDGTMVGMVYGYTATQTLLVGSHVITAELVNPSHQPLGLVDTVNVTVNPATIAFVTPTNNQVFTATNGTSVMVPLEIATNITIPTDGHWHLWVDGSMVSMVYGYTTTQTLLAGSHVITAELVDTAHQPLGPVATVNVTVKPVTIAPVGPSNGLVFTATNGSSVDVLLVITTTNFTIPTDGHWSLWVDGSLVRMVYDYTTTETLFAGAHVITGELVDTADQPLGPAATWDATVNPVSIAFVTPTNNQIFVATNGTSVNAPLQITTTNFAIPTDGHWHLWVDGTMVGPVLGYTATQTLLVGAHVITAELQSPTHVPLGPVATVNVVVNSTGIAFVTPTNGQVFTATNNVSLSIPIQITTTNFVIPTDGHWHLWVDGSLIGPVLGYTTTQTLLAGAHVITAELQSPTHVPLGPVATVTVQVKKIRPYGTYLPMILR